MRPHLRLVLMLSVLPACGSTAAIDQPAEASDAIAARADGWYFVRADLRKCASPMCGGFFLERANLSRTVCFDGRARAECYVAAIDWSATQFSADERAKLESAPVVMHGRLVDDGAGGGGAYADLRVTDVWAPAVAPDVPPGGYPAPAATLYRAWDNGTRCITWPCPSTTQAKLNTSQTWPVAGVDLSDSCANDRQVAAAYDALATPTGILVDGSDGWVSGPGGRMKELAGSDFYLRVEPADAGPRACGGFIGRGCDGGEYCDITVPNACRGADLPGVCKPIPQMCTQLYQPVCGCDGTTYSNDCFRVAALVQLDHTGACAE